MRKDGCHCDKNIFYTNLKIKTYTVVKRIFGKYLKLSRYFTNSFKGYDLTDIVLKKI